MDMLARSTLAALLELITFQQLAMFMDVIQHLHEQIRWNQRYDETDPLDALPLSVPNLVSLIILNQLLMISPELSALHEFYPRHRMSLKLRCVCFQSSQMVPGL
jgi:hypothetical protein